MRRPSVFIVEDELIVAMDLQQTLREFGYDAFAIASSAEAAVIKASERCPDLVLMDIRIAGNRDGIETAEILRAQFSVPVVFLTAHADEATLNRAKIAEPHGYLVKPVKAAELRSTIEIALYRHEIEKRLRERERWFSTTLDSIADGVVTVDLAGKVTFMNPPAEHLTGVTLPRALGRPAAEVIRLRDPVTDSALDSPLDAALKWRQPVHVSEANLLGATDAGKLVSDSAAPVDDAGNLLGAVMIFRDITEQKRLQKQLEMSDRLSSLGTMAAGVAHEINNPLAVVMANGSFIHDELTTIADAMRSGGGDPQRSLAMIGQVLEAQGELVDAAARIRRIVVDLKAFSRPGPSLTLGGGDVARTIAWAVRATAHELRHRARLETNIGELPQTDVDEVRLGQVLVNLLVNAAHAISPGKVEDNKVSITVTADGTSVLTIKVADSGCGMPPHVVERIFEPFFTTKPVGTGTGLGLSVSHGIVKSLGGEIHVESRVGSGTTFTITLPVAGNAAERESARAAPDVAQARARGRILVVDDEPLVLRAIQRILAQHELTCTHLAQEALQRIERGETFDLILCDVMMPSMTGVDLYEALLRVAPDSARRVAFLTGGALTAKVEDFLRSVANRRIEKPFGGAELIKAVEAGLAERARIWDEPLRA